jgi:hypothetical protein
MTDVAYSTPVPDRPAEEFVSDRSAGLAPCLLLGIGLAGPIHGIVFHEILQWHNIFSNAVPPNDLAYRRRLENDFPQQSVLIRAERAPLF